MFMSMRNYTVSNLTCRKDMVALEMKLKQKFLGVALTV